MNRTSLTLIGVGIALILICGVVLSAPFEPSGSINLRGIYGLYNATYLNATYFYQGGYAVLDSRNGSWVSDQVGNYSASQGELYSNISSLQNSNSTTNSRIDSVNSTTGGIYTNVSGLQSSNSTTNSRIDSLNSTMGGIYTNVSGVNQSLQEEILDRQTNDTKTYTNSSQGATAYSWGNYQLNTSLIRVGNESWIVGAIGNATALNVTLQSEITSRSSNDTAINNSLNSEITSRQSNDTAINNSLNSEISSRQSNDTSINNSLNTEISSRQSNDSAINNSLNSEVTSRQGNDTNLYGNASLGNQSYVWTSANHTTWDWAYVWSNANHTYWDLSYTWSNANHTNWDNAYDNRNQYYTNASQGATAYSWGNYQLNKSLLVDTNYTWAANASLVNGNWSADKSGYYNFSETKEYYVEVGNYSDIQVKLDYCAANGGGRVILPAGTYNVDGIITKPTNCSISGYKALLKTINLTNKATPTTTIQCEAGSHKGTVIEGIEIDQQALVNFNESWGTSLDSPFSEGIYCAERLFPSLTFIGQAEDVTIRDVYVHDTIRSGIVPSTRTVIKNVRVENSLGDHLIYLSAGNDSVIEDVYLSGYVASEYIVLSTDTTAYAQRNTIRNIHFSNLTINPKWDSEVITYNLIHERTGFNNQIEGFYYIAPGINNPKLVPLSMQGYNSTLRDIYIESNFSMGYIIVYRGGTIDHMKIYINNTNRTTEGYVISASGDTTISNSIIDIQDNSPYYRIMLIGGNASMRITNTLFKNTNGRGIIAPVGNSVNISVSNLDYYLDILSEGEVRFNQIFPGNVTVLENLTALNIFGTWKGNPIADAYIANASKWDAINTSSNIRGQITGANAANFNLSTSNLTVNTIQMNGNTSCTITGNATAITLCCGSPLSCAIIGNP